MREVHAARHRREPGPAARDGVRVAVEADELGARKRPEQRLGVSPATERAVHDARSVGEPLSPREQVKHFLEEDGDVRGHRRFSPQERTEKFIPRSRSAAASASLASRRRSWQAAARRRARARLSSAGRGSS